MVQQKPVAQRHELPSGKNGRNNIQTTTSQHSNQGQNSEKKKATITSEPFNAKTNLSALIRRLSYERITGKIEKKIALKKIPI